MDTLDEIKQKAHALKPILQVGKGGITDSVILEIKKHVKKRKLIKIKILKNVLENQSKEELIAHLETIGSIRVVSVVGNVVTLCSTQ
jgi:RNA-binding protein